MYYLICGRAGFAVTGGRAAKGYRRRSLEGRVVLKRHAGARWTGREGKGKRFSQDRPVFGSARFLRLCETSRYLAEPGCELPKARQ